MQLSEALDLKISVSAGYSGLGGSFQASVGSEYSETREKATKEINE